MDERISIRQYLENFDNGVYDSPDVDVQISAGWYDWFCFDSSLQKKTISLTKKLKRIVNSKKINQDTSYVWFKNNCPINGILYDDFRIADLETNDTIWCITPKSGHNRSRVGDVYSCVTGETVFTGTWKEIVKWFNE